MAMGDITRIEITQFKEDGNWDEWPYPTIKTTSRITGELRDKILKLTGHEVNDTIKVTIVETNISTGWSEFTQENDYAIEVFIGAESAKVWDYETSEESAMSRFLTWVDTPTD